MTQFKGVSGGRLNVAVISAGDYFFPRLLVEFARRHAGVTLNFGVCNREELLGQLADNLTDLAIMVRPPRGPTRWPSPSRRTPMSSSPRADHPLAKRTAGFRCRGWHASRSWCARRAPTPGTRWRRPSASTWRKLNIAMEIKSTETIKQAVIAGMGVTFLSAHTISRELRAGSLAVLNVQGFPLMLHWYVVHRKSKRLPPVAQAFKNFLMKDGASLIEQAVGARPKRPK